jgi:hypothetical protein
MHYVLLSSTGNMVDSYEEESIARAALQRIVDAEPEAVEDVALMIYGEDGQPVGGPLFAKTPSGLR